ncbi:MAG: cytochrome c-type biogenesis CcmF C-terminal domain-containing protein [Myxococcota bacterium]
MWQSLPQFGTVILAAILVAASYTFAVSIAAGAGRPRLLQSARAGAYGTVSLVAVAVLVLAYAFVTHDFRLDYVARYSDRTMTTPWLIAALWGGQDGSLLWWLFLTSAFSGGCVWWLKGRYRQLQPYVIATLMSVLIFLAILMLFATNPFRTLPSGALPDGAGLNYQLRNFYMIIHPPSLYIGFTSAAVPFAFAVAAMVTGRLDNEWIVATRKWMVFSWLFLSIGNALGMLWAYEELGWGGYWAWDPVENAAFLPWLTASAYVHSTMIQERRGMLKVWNVSLIFLTFFLTYFGTFLTRSGLIASVHSFAKSDIGNFFLGYMLVILATSGVLVGMRYRQLRAKNRIDSLLSREFMFVMNNWVLLLMMVFIAVATVWPRISEALYDQEATVGPPFYNAYLPPLGLVLIFLMGTAPLLGWRKTSRELFIKSFRWPVGVAVTVGALHLALGERLGYPAIYDAEPLYPGAMGQALASVKSVLPFITVMLVAYNLVVVAQEFQRGVASRRRKKKEGVLVALATLVSKSRRRYGGYTVHVGIAIMFLGFAGKAWEQETEVSLAPGEVVTLGEYELTYRGPRMEVDHEKRMILADIAVKRHGEDRGTVTPARFIYKASPGQPSTEVAIFNTVRNDLYVSPGVINAQSKVATFRVHINPLVSFVWLGVIILIIGTTVALWPDPRPAEATAFTYMRALASAATMVMLSVMLALAPNLAYSGSADTISLSLAPDPTPE